jgi:hypothetical protein
MLWLRGSQYVIRVRVIVRHFLQLINAGECLVEFGYGKLLCLR